MKQGWTANRRTLRRGLIAAGAAAATVLADHVFALNFLVQFVYFAVVGFVWVFPIRWLMLWSVHQR